MGIRFPSAVPLASLILVPCHLRADEVAMILNRSNQTWLIQRLEPGKGFSTLTGQAVAIAPAINHNFTLPPPFDRAVEDWALVDGHGQSLCTLRVAGARKENGKPELTVQPIPHPGAEARVREVLSLDKDSKIYLGGPCYPPAACPLRRAWSAPGSASEPETVSD